MRARTRTARKSASAPSGWSGSSGWRDRRVTRELAVVGEESAVVAHLEDEVVERAVQGEAGVADELERAGSAGGAGHRAGGRGVRANLVQALVRRRGGGRANRRRRGRRRRRRAGIRDRKADERRHGERARERDERARAAREDDAARRRSAGGDARDPSASRAQRQLSTHGARGRERRVRVGRSCARRPRSRTRSRLRSRPCRGGDARGGEARPQTRAAKWAGPTDTGRGERSSSAGVSPAAALGQHSSARQSSQPRPVSGISSIERWFRSVRIETVRANTTDRPGIVPVSPPRSLDQSRVASTSRAEEPQPLSSSRAADGAWCASAGGISPRAAPLATRAGTAQVRLSPARSRAGRPPSRARAFASPTALSPRPPLPFAAIDPRVVTRPDRRRLARCPPAPRSPPAPGRSARPPRRA